MVDQDPQFAKLLSARFYTWELISRLAGTSMLFVRDVDRSPHFKVETGATGTLLQPCLDDNGMIFVAIKLDSPPDGATDFDDECHWIEGSTLPDFELDVVRIPTPVVD